MKNKCKYLSAEGTDGSGKTTLVKNLLEYFEKEKLKVLHTKEFGSDHNNLCKDLRGLAISSAYDTDELAGQIIFAAIVRQHQERVIKPALAEDRYDLILSDRGPDSNFAYGPTHGVNNSLITKLFKVAYNEAILPDLTIFLDVHPDITAKRRSTRTAEIFQNSGTDRVEKKGSKFQAKVRKQFLKLAEKNPERIKSNKIIK
jgi:dTMP kinase